MADGQYREDGCIVSAQAHQDCARAMNAHRFQIFFQSGICQKADMALVSRKLESIAVPINDHNLVRRRATRDCFQ